MRISDWSSDVCSSDLVVLGIVVIVIAALLNDVVAALTIAYDILVGGLLVAILGGFVWKRATGTGALWSDRKSVVTGKRVSVRVDLGGRRSITKKSKSKRAYTAQPSTTTLNPHT